MQNDMNLSLSEEITLDTLIINEYQYICHVNNLDYIINKQKCNKYLHKFLNKCQQYKIKYYKKENDKYGIFSKTHIFEQINIIKKQNIQTHINALQTMCNAPITNKNYLDINTNLINIIHKSLHDLDKLEKITEYIYDYNILCIDDMCKSINSVITSNNFVDFSEINDEFILSHTNIKYIDEYK